jgi:hypothetical protein
VSVDIHIGDSEQSLTTKFYGVLQLGGCHVRLAKGLTYLQDEVKKRLYVESMSTISSQMCNEGYLATEGSSGCNTGVLLQETGTLIFVASPSQLGPMA